VRFIPVCLFTFLLLWQLKAGVHPLSNKEIALMLRTGYSCDEVQREITSRRVLEPLDEATKKSLVSAGATQQLIATLESGTYVVRPEEAEQVKARETEIAAQRAAQIEQDRQHNTLLQARAAEARAKAAAAPPAGETLLLDALKEKLVRCRQGDITRANGNELEKKKLVAVYYSAHWCGPCRKFTPKLVEYYNRVAAAHPEFELVFVSCDRSRFAWQTYIKETHMPWLAVDYEQLGSVASLRQLGGDSIPSLLVLDEGSRVVASSYAGEKYVGPESVLAALDQIFTGKSGQPLAQVR